jgi:mannosyl-3-phosphoglycerate phosphatase
MPRLVVFSDMDGTLLHAKTYEFEAALPAIDALKARGVPLVLVSSKTRAEIEHYRSILCNHDPFVVENGAAVFIPKGSFPFPVEGARELAEGYFVMEFGTQRARILEALGRASCALGVKFLGFASMDDAEVAERTGLPLELARLARAREYDEPLVLDASMKKSFERLKACLAEEGLRLTQGGRFAHALGPNDKGLAVLSLRSLFERLWPECSSVGLGDAQNDLPMLNAVDIPFVIPNPWVDQSALACVPRQRRALHIAPQGFTEAISDVLSEVS